MTDFSVVSTMIDSAVVLRSDCPHFILVGISGADLLGITCNSSKPSLLVPLHQHVDFLQDVHFNRLL